MKTDHLINTTLIELKQATKPYLMFNDLSVLKDPDLDDDDKQKIRYTLLNSEPFSKHSVAAIKLSPRGIEIVSNYDDWYDYKKSQKPKFDYFKLIALIIAALSLAWNVYQGLTKNQLREENRIIIDENEALIKENKGLQKLLIQCNSK